MDERWGINDDGCFVCLDDVAVCENLTASVSVELHLELRRGSGVGDARLLLFLGSDFCFDVSGFSSIVGVVLHAFGFIVVGGELANALVRRERREQHAAVSACDSWLLVDLCHAAEVFDDAVENDKAEFFVSILTTTEHEADFDLVTSIEEFFDT